VGSTERVQPRPHAYHCLAAKWRPKDKAGRGDKRALAENAKGAFELLLLLLLLLSSVARVEK
jgi:hypothetical protein